MNGRIGSLSAGTIAQFLLGNESAIRAVASSSAAIWTGIALTMLTAFARSYDQTFILANPLLWLFGPLAFSLVSGTFLFRLTYGIGARGTMAHTPDSRPALWKHWRGFMGAFWLTAPIAWLYALPVERFFDSLTSTKINIGLLAVVALWRVLLMARVLQVVCQAPFRRTLLWVLGASFAEVLLVGFFGGAFGKSLMASMGGMRNSPEEDLLLNAFGFVATVSFWGIPVVVLLLAVWRWPGPASEWPGLHPAAINWKPIVAAAVFWIGITIPAQLELRHN
ncbi:MAG TPA: hypothetical protein DCY13_02540, partial [Verrucomicrobiales bacterium]|nr:hypothetical protein [Verrucomicrobiales bacterium]